MKKITILLAAFLFVFAAGCREDASLDGLESQTKEEGSTAGETAESKAVKEALNYASEQQYNWVMEYELEARAAQSLTILFNFQSDSSVATDSPLSDNEKSLAIYSVISRDGGKVVIKFDGPTMLSDEIVPEQARERELIVEKVTDTQIQCLGATSGRPAVLRHATSDDVLKLGEKLVWLALSKQNAMQGVLRATNGKFLARYALDKSTRTIDFTWIDALSKDANHQTAAFTLDVTSTLYTLKWPSVEINGQQFNSLDYTIATNKAAFNVAETKIDAPIRVTPDFVDKSTKQYNLGGKLKCGTAHPSLWTVLASDKFRSVLFYPYPDDIPLRVEAYKNDGTVANYLFVNDYSGTPKTAHYDTDADWVRFYASTWGDYLKDAQGSPAQSYSLEQMGIDLKPFADFYFHADGLYTIPETDAKGKAFYLISKTSNLWVKVRVGMVSEPGESPEPEQNYLPQLIEAGMKPYGTFFDNAKKNLQVHYMLNASAGTADLIWITDAETRYTDGAYKEMANNKAQYKTVAVSATQDGVITFKEPLIVGDVTYKGLTWATTYTPNVEGLACTIRTSLQNAEHPLDYFFTYPVNKYEGGTPVFIPYSRFCLPTTADNISGMTGTDRYLFYPYTQPGGSTPAGPCALEVYPVGKGQRIDIKSFKSGQETHTVSIAISAFQVEDDRMIFTKGAVSGSFVDKDGNNVSTDESKKLVAPIEKLLFAPQGFHVYKAESVTYDNNKHYFFLVSPDPKYPYWIKIREV